MAFLSDINDQTQQQLGQTTAPPGLNNTAAPITPAGAGGTSAAGGRTASPVAAPNTASSQSVGTPATNVSAYMQANAPQVQQYGNNITGQLNGQYGQALSDINTAGTNFNNQVTSGYTPLNQNVIDSAASNPTATASNPTDLAAFQAQATDTYTGPTQFETSSSYAPLEQEIGSTQNNATPWTTFSGTESQFQGLGDTTPGEQQLDATLIQQTPNVVSNINTAAGQAAALTPAINTVASTSDQAVTAAQANANLANTNANAAFTGDTAGAVLPSLTAQLNSELSSDQAGYTAKTTEYADINEKVTNNDLKDLTPQELQDLGITEDQVQNYINYQNEINNLPIAGGTSAPIAVTPNFTPGTPPAFAPSLSNIETPAEYAELQAISQLLPNAQLPVALSSVQPGSYAAALAADPEASINLGNIPTVTTPGAPPTGTDTGETGAQQQQLTASDWASLSAPIGNLNIGGAQTTVTPQNEAAYTAAVSGIQALGPKPNDPTQSSTFANTWQAKFDALANQALLADPLAWAYNSYNTTSQGIVDASKPNSPDQTAMTNPADKAQSEKDIGIFQDLNSSDQERAIALLDFYSINGLFNMGNGINAGTPQASNATQRNINPTMANWNAVNQTNIGAESQALAQQYQALQRLAAGENPQDPSEVATEKSLLQQVDPSGIGGLSASGNGGTAANEVGAYLTSPQLAEYATESALASGVAASIAESIAAWITDLMSTI